ncbi:A-kinase anchor protein 10, mitochondrial [Manduca sexta]|uniref:RGS domain-containing protein n=1 Tax=Manduca sexta TaxID=7130 RepID=A0A922CDW0_MANSE|nr:A-kinase anchor protein 10, mitochondrial [Manduca sexta]KAG6442627.1 hypothetical protein O3G_MSEX002489 [Manduca sexta]
MIKFWKSAAKGKSGCPVRPPELNPPVNTEIRSLDAQSVDENGETLNMFEKKSKLSLSLHDILVGKKALKYFIQFMQTIGQQLLVRAWQDMENFETLVKNSGTNNDINNHSQLNRTQSFDLHCKCKPDKQNNRVTTQSLNLTLNTNMYNIDNANKIVECSTSSCENLVDCVNSQAYRSCENVNRSDLSEESVKLFKKYVALEAPCQLDLPDSIRKLVISNICNPEGLIREDCFKPVQEKLYSHIQDNYFNDFVGSPLYIQAQIDILTSGSLNLKDILYNETILFYFTEYLEQESCRVLLEFLMAVIHFRDNSINDNALNPDQMQADAIVIYDKYFSLQATSPISFPAETRLQIESEICREGGPLNTCFDIPFQFIFKTLTQYVKTFLESELYYKYLSEMIHSVDQRWSTNQRSQSDCSSEYSISTQNTLLAMGDPVFRKKKRNHSVPDMTIDSNQLYNADSLWQRQRHDGLSLGRVNSLGRFESKLEPDPDRKESIFKKMVSRFVPTNTSKVEEEMAWQVAHMIVKDVTDLTMAPPDNDHDDL